MNELQAPTCVSQEAWEAFIELRRRKGQRAPLTDYAANLIIKKLIEADRQGYDAQYMLDEAIEKGWTSVYVNERTPKVSKAVAETKRYLESQRQSPEQRAASDAARKVVMARFGRAA